jgi:hypothetical protein
MLHSLRRSIVSKSRVVVSRAQQQQPQQQQRRWAGDMPVPQSSTAPMWGGHDTKVTSEGWELSIYAYYAIAVLMQGAIILGAPETSIESWARPEAQARLKLAAQGNVTEFEFGKHYAGMLNAERNQVWEKFGDRAVIPGDDDDDDDDEDEVSKTSSGLERCRRLQYILLYYSYLTNYSILILHITGRRRG